MFVNTSYHWLLSFVEYHACVLVFSLQLSLVGVLSPLPTLFQIPFQLLDEVA